MKKFDIEKSKGLKLTNSLKNGGTSSRFGQEASLPKFDKREQRRADQQMGLVPFACKLNEHLVAQLQARATEHEGGMSAVLAEILVAAGFSMSANAEPVSR